MAEALLTLKARPLTVDIDMFDIDMFDIDMFYTSDIPRIATFVPAAHNEWQLLRKKRNLSQRT